MAAGSTPPHAPHHQRSTTALVLSRSTTGRLSEAERPPAPGEGAPLTSWRWALVTWIILGAAIAALWALLLLGDSLAPMPQQAAAASVFSA